MNTILLMGNPNVGKSAIFSRLTGARVIASNYPGTTVELTKGNLKLENQYVEIIDTPGTYTLEASTEAEKVSVKILRDTFNDNPARNGVVINIVDSTNLERNLNLTLDILKQRIPVIIALNFWDEAAHTGVYIDTEKLERWLGVPVVPTCGITGEGIKHLVSTIPEAKISGIDFDEQDRWKEIGKIVSDVQKLTHKHHTPLETFSDYSVHPFFGIPIALAILFIAFSLIRLIGENIIKYIADPVFNHLWAPIMMKLSKILKPGSIIHDIVIGRLFDSQIDFGESFGMLTTGLYVPLAAVLPYIVAFYIILSILEDSGYLPRIAVMVDNGMHRIGLHGYGIIPMILGLGCNVPGALSARIMETKRERFLALTVMAIAVPCMAQIAMIMGLVGKEGARGLFLVFGILFLIWIVLGLLLNRILSGRAPELFIEIPPYRLPYWKSLMKKVWTRVQWFIKEAIPWVLIGVLAINIMYSLGIIQFIGNLMKPVISGLFGLPPAAVGALIVGFLRKDVAVGMLVPLHLSFKQLVIASVILTMYFPCAATFAVMIRELGIKDMIRSALIMILSAVTVGSLLNLIL
jgi:ferrous iron transport protein B